MKQIFNHINGRALGMAFTDDSTDQAIANHFRENLADIDYNFDLELNEEFSCEVTFDADTRIITVNGDEDFRVFDIQGIELIQLTIN